MKNVTDSLKPSDSTEIIPARPANFFDKDDFTISVNDFYFGEFSRHNPMRNLEALQALKAEALKRGYMVDEWNSMETMVRYMRFYKRRP